MTRGFLPPAKVNSRTEPPSTRLAVQLYNGLRSQRLIGVKTDIRCWTREMLKLLQTFPYEEIAQTIDWYCAHALEENMPHIRSARSLRSKYVSVRNLMPATATAAPITPEVEAIVRRLRQDAWPCGLDAQLPEVVQKSIETYGTFWRKAKVLETKLSQKVGLFATLREPSLPISGRQELCHAQKLLRLLRHCFGMRHLSKPAHFVEWWLDTIRDSVCTWKGWEGTAQSITFSMRSRWLLRLGRSWAYDYCNASVVWDQLLIAILEVKEQSA